MMRSSACFFAMLAALLIGIGAFGSAAVAKTLLVGSDQALKVPSAAAAVAADGDTIEIEPRQGGYFDCVVWKQNKLTIEGKGDASSSPTSRARERRCS